MLKVFLIRHGQTDWNIERRVMGRLPIPLNENGIAQVHHLKKAFHQIEIDTIYSSPIFRASQSAEIISKPRSMDIIFDERLSEVVYGSWEGKTFQEIRQSPGYINYYLEPERPVVEGGESLLQVQNRMRDFLNSLSRHEESSPKIKNILAFSHADSIKCLYLDLIKAPVESLWRIRLDNAAFLLLEIEAKTTRVICFNYTSKIEALFVSRKFH